MIGFLDTSSRETIQFARPICEHLSYYVSDIIYVDIELLLGKELEIEMSSGAPYYEPELLNVLRHGQCIPAVPLVLIEVLS